jgi:hypothetical protein
MIKNRRRLNRRDLELPRAAKSQPAHLIIDAVSMLSLATLTLGSLAAPLLHNATLTNNATVTLSRPDVQDAAYHVHFCVDPTKCDEWALERPGSTSAMMPQECRTAPQPDDVQAIAVSFGANARAEGDLLLTCGETPRGVEEIRAFRKDPFVRAVANAAMESTDCALVSLEGSVEQRHTQLRRLYAELKMCGFDALQVPHKQAPTRPLGPLRKNPNKEEIVAMISEEVYMRELSMLTGDTPIQLPGGESYTIATRNTNQEGNLFAADFIARSFVDLGLEASLQEFTCCGGVSARNIVARQPGVEFPDEIIVVGGHFDSLPNGNLAPGAVDNGSGTMGVLALAKVFSQFSFSRTIEYVAFGAEEQGLHGSAHYVALAQARGENIVCALTMDMIGYSNVYYGVTIEGTTSPPILELMDLAAANTKEFAPGLTIATSTFSFGSDHVSFQRAGIPAILAIEQDDTNYICYHRDCDRMEYINAGQACDIVRGQAGTLVDLASGMRQARSNLTNGTTTIR